MASAHSKLSAPALQATPQPAGPRGTVLSCIAVPTHTPDVAASMAPGQEPGHRMLGEELQHLSPLLGPPATLATEHQPEPSREDWPQFTQLTLSWMLLSLLPWPHLTSHHQFSKTFLSPTSTQALRPGRVSAGPQEKESTSVSHSVPCRCKVGGGESCRSPQEQGQTVSVLFRTTSANSYERQMNEILRRAGGRW